MIPQGEKLMTMKEAAAWLLTARGLRRSAHTVYCWAKNGCRNIKLEVLCVGGRMHTSAEAMERFFVKLSPTEDAAVEADDDHAPRGIAGLTPKQQRDHEEGMRRCRELGLL